MTFRDDHDAALARIDALEQELESERAERQRLEAIVAGDSSLAPAIEPAERERRDKLPMLETPIRTGRWFGIVFVTVFFALFALLYLLLG